MACETYRSLGLAPKLELSTRPAERIGDDAMWDTAEAALKEEANAIALEEIEAEEERSWNYRMIAIGYFAGLVSGIVLAWLFFP